MKLPILKYLLAVAGLLLLFFIEQSLLLHLRPVYLAGGGIYLLIFLLSFFCQKQLSYFAAVLGGFLLDMSSPYSFGIFILTLSLMVFIIQKSERFFNSRNIFAFVWLLIFFALFYKFLPLLLEFLFQLSR